MSQTLNTIKRLVFRRQIIWTAQSESQMSTDDLTRDEVVESILNARLLRAKKSTSPDRRTSREKVYIIVGKTFAGLPIYTKGVIRREADREVFYVIISARRARSLS
jgi:hypothetical protein